MQVQIVQLQQEMDLRTRKTVTFAILELPNGKQVRMPVDETAAAAIIEADIEENGAPPSAETEGATTLVVRDELPSETGDEPDVSDYGTPPQITTIEETETQRVREFGGDVPPQAAANPKPATKKRGTRKQRASSATASLLPPTPEPPPPPPKSNLPEGHVVPQSTAHYKALVKQGKITPNAFARHVSMDNWGYPIPQMTAGTADPHSIVGQRNQDEDGIGSV